MSDLPPEIALTTLAPPTEPTLAVQRWGGFISARPAEHSTAAPPAILVNAGEAAAWHQHVHRQTAPVPELGAALVDHVHICGQCYVFRDGQMLADGSEPHRVARTFLADEHLPPERLILRDRRVILDAPALVIGGPGYWLWGHWLLDFLPRLAIARAALGAQIDRFAIPLPSNAPGWVADALQFFGNIAPERLFYFDLHAESVFCRRACIPSYAHRDYFLHSFLREFYQRAVPARPDLPTRICLSRTRFNAAHPQGGHRFVQEAYFEASAERHGYSVIAPETLDFASQVALFTGAEAIIGQAGSAMHNAVFAKPGTLVGQVGMPNAHQSRIAGLCGHRLAYLFPDAPTPGDTADRLSVNTAQIDAFFTALADAGPG